MVKWDEVKVFSNAKKRKRNDYFQSTRQTLRFCVLAWDWKLCILEYQDYCVKYFSTLVFKNPGENRNFEISTSIFIFFLLLSAWLLWWNWDIWEYEGFGWMNIKWLNLSGKNLKLSKACSHVIQTCWTVPSHPQHWHHNRIKWNSIQKLGKYSELVVCSSVLPQKTLVKTHVL